MDAGHSVEVLCIIRGVMPNRVVERRVSESPHHLCVLAYVSGGGGLRKTALQVQTTHV